MKKKILFLSLTGMLIAGFFVFNACKKASPAIPPASTTQSDADYVTASTDNSRAEQTFSDVFNASEDAVTVKGMNKTGQNLLLGTCAKVYFESGHDSTKFPLYVTIDFGTTGCVGLDNRTRKGKIHLVLTDRYRNTGATLTATLDNFYVTEVANTTSFYAVEGTKTITNNGKKTDANGTSYSDYSVVVTNGRITSPSGAYATWTSTRERKEYLDGNGFVAYWLISGSASGINTLGNGYTVDVSSTDPLKIVPFCKWIEEGAMTLTSGGNSITIDFGKSGSGVCDANATALINGKSYPFVMK